MSEYLVSKEDKRAKRNEPWEVDYHGMVLHIRLEHNLETKEIKKIVVTVREELEEQGRHRVAYGKVLLTRKYTPVCQHTLYDGDVDLETAVQATLDKKMADSFLPDLFKAYPTMMVPELSCAILLPYALNRLNAIKSVGKGTLLERKKALEDILAHWGDSPLLELTPERCAPVLLEMPKKRAEKCITLLRQVFAGTFVQIVTDPHQWEHYHMSGRRGKFDATQRIRRELLSAEYTDAQCAIFVQRCSLGVARNNKKATWYAMAGIMLVTGLTVEKVCALRTEDFKRMKEYIGMYVDVHQELVVPEISKKEGRKRRIRNTAVEIDDCHNRRLALGSWARELSAPIAEIDGRALVLHDPRNAQRCLDPKKYAKWLADTFGDITAGRAAYGMEEIKDTHTVEDYLCGTAPFYLVKNGYLAEEVRHQKGLAPRHTDAQYYVDLQSETELVTMAAMQDQWIANLSVEKKKDISHNSSRKKYEYEGKPKQLLRARITILLPPGTELPTDMRICLSATGGMTAVVTSKSNHEAK